MPFNQSFWERQDIKENIEYLSGGGLGETIGLTISSEQSRFEKVQMDTHLALTLLALAEIGLEVHNAEKH